MKNLLKQIILPFILIILLPKAVFATSGASSEALQFRTVIGQKLKTKIDEVFISTPKLLETYNKVQSTELSAIGNLPEYHNLVNSRELKLLNHSPEMQEAWKELITEISTEILGINQKIAEITSQVSKLEKELREQPQSDISVSEIKRKIYAKEAVIKGLKTGISDSIQSLNQQKQLYFTDSNLAKTEGDFTPIQKPDALTTGAILAGIINLDQIIDTRMTTVSLNDFTVSAGDEMTQEDGVWIKGIKSHAKQNQYQLVQGYKSDQVGVVIGLDFIMDNTIGLAYAFIQDRVKGHTIKDKINTHIATIYGLYELGKNLFVDAQARYGRSYISKSRCNMNLSGDISHAKTGGDLYGGKLELYYNYITGRSINIIPSMGISYDELRIRKYREKGTGFNRQVGSRTVDKTAGLFGIKVSKAMEFGSYSIIPEIHIKSIHTFSAHNDNTVITILDGMEPLVTPSGKLQKTIYKLGGLLKIRKSNPVSIEIGYDFGKSKKYYSHTGYVSAILAF